MNISFNELDKFFKKLIDKSEASGFNQFEIDNDFYWNLTPEESFNFNNTNPKMTVGSLFDDYNHLKQMMREDILTPIDFERLAHLLLAISYLISSSDKPFLG